MSFEKRMLEILQRKYAEALQANFNNELNFLAEQAKNAELQEKINELTAKIETLSNKKKKKDSDIDSESY